MNKQIYCLLLSIFLVFAVKAGEAVVEIIPVYNRPASELMPILRPLLDSSDQVVANGDSLIVKTLPERVQTLTNLVRKLDSPMTNLLISVVQSHDTTAAELNAGVGGSISFPMNAPSAVSGQIGGFANQYQGNHRNQNTQSIRTLEGGTAYIKSGNVYPISTYQTYPNPYGYPTTTQSTQYMEASTGFAVTPRLTGNQVTLDVSPWSDSLGRQGQFQVQETETSIRVNLGEWVEIGSVNETQQSSGNGIFAYNNQSGHNQLRILVKVDVIN